MNRNVEDYVGIKPGLAVLDTEPKTQFAKNNAPGAGTFPMIIPEKDKNSGGLVGGIGYTAGKLGTGLAGVFEGIGKGVEGIGSLIAGDKEYAKYVFSNSEVDKWRKQLDDWYNPGSIMSFVGDAAEGVGQSSVFLLNAIPGLGQAGTAAFFVGAAGNGISDAVRTTGDIGAKEITYGLLSSAAESAMEAVSGAGGKAAKAIAGKVTVGVGKRAVSNLAATAAKQATWKMIGKEMVTSAAGEFVEEFLGDFVDVGLRRMTGVDPNASTSVGQALYSGLVGAASGAIMGGVSSAVVQRGNQTRGRRIIEAGNADATVGVAQAFSEQYAKSKDKLIRGINEELKTSIGAWNKVTDQSTPAAARIMGEIQSTLGNLNLIEAVQDEAAKIKRIVSEDPTKGEAMIQYLNIVTGIKDASNGFKAEDLLRDGSDALNLMSVLGFAGEAMTNSDSQVRKEMYRKAMNGEDISADKLNITTDKQTGKKQQRVYSFYADENTVIDENVRDAVYGNGTGERMALHNNGDGTYNVGFGDSAKNATTYPHVTKERAERVLRDFGAYGKQYIAEHELNYQKAAQTSGMQMAAEQTAQVSQVTNPGKIGTEDLKVKGNASENVAVKQETVQAENIPANAPKTGNTQTAVREEVAEKAEAKKDGKGETGKSSDAGKTVSEEKSSVEQIREKMTEEEKVRAGKNSARMKQLRERMVKTKQEIAQLEDPKAKRTMSETARENRLAKLRKQLETDQARYNTLTRENERIGKRAETGKAQAEPTSKTEQAKAEKRADFEEEYSSTEEAKADPGNNADERITKISDAAWRDGQTYLKTFDRLSWDRKRAVCATIQSAKDAGVTSKLVISASAKLASIRSGLEIRFSDKVASSSWTKIDPEHGERLVLVSTKSADQIVIRAELVHEMIHDLRYTNSAAYAKIKKAAFDLTTDERAAEIYDQYTGHFNEKNLSDYLKENNLERTEENIDKYFEKYDGISRENVEEEITAKYVMNDARVNRLFDRLGDRSTWRKFLDAVSDFREAISERFSGKGEDEQLLVRQSGSIEKTILKALGADYAAERVMRSYGYDGKEAYGERTSNAKNKYNLDERLDEQLQDWLRGGGKKFGKYNGKYFELGTTPSVLVKHGAERVPVIMFEDCLAKVTGLKSDEAHSISLGEIAKLPSQLNDPIMLFNGSVKNSFVALTELKDKHGNDVIVAVHLNKMASRTVVNKIASLYSKVDRYGNNHIVDYVLRQIDEGNLIDASNKKAPNWFTASGLQLPHAVQTILDANNSISQKSEKSTKIQKKNLSEKTDTEEDANEPTGTYDYSKSFPEQIDDYKKGIIPERDSLVVSGTPELLQKVGFNALPVTINQTHVDYALNGTKDADHYLGETLLKQLPKAIADPVAVIGSQTIPSRAMEILEFKVNGKQTVIPVEIDGYAHLNNIRIDSNAIVSVYGKNSALQQLADAISGETQGKTTLFYWKKKEATSLLQSAGHHLPGGLPQDGFIHSIRENTSFVKSKFQDVTETQQFKRWFGDWEKHPEAASKVVNADGTPKVVYHQTDAEFTVFDTRREGAGTRDSGTPFGIFLKSSDRDIGLKGKKQMALYADIRNPLQVENREELSRKIRSMSAEYDQLITQNESLTLEYEKKIAEAEKRSRDYITEWVKNHPDTDSRELYKIPEFNQLMDTEVSLAEEWTQKADALSEKAKNAMTEALEKNGYDGVFLRNDEGSFGRKTDAYIALHPEQVKSVTDNIGTFSGTTPDIRYNLSETSDTDKDAKIAKLTEELNEARKGEEQAKKEAKNAKKRAEHSEKEAKHKMQAAYECVKVVDEIKKMSEAMRGNTQIVRDEVSTQVIKLAEKIGRNVKNPFKESSSEVFDLFATVKKYMVDEDAANPGMMAEQNGDWSFADRFTPRAKAIIEELAAQAGSKKTLTEEDLWNVRNGLYALKHAVQNADKVVINERKESLSRTAAEGVRGMEEMASLRAKDETANPLFRVARTISDAVRKKYFYQVMTPIAVIDSLEGYSNGPLTRIYHDVEKAADKARVDYLRYVKMQEEFFEKNKGYGKHLRSDNVNVMGNEITRGVAISLYMTTKREQAVLHIEGQGIKMENVKGEVVHLAEDQLIPYKERLDGKILTTRLQTEIEKQLTAEDKAYIGVLESFFNDVATRDKCDADDVIQGFHELMEAYYFPISADKVAMVGSVTDARKGFMDMMSGITNSSFLKQVNPKAKNAIFISDVNDVFDNHARQLSLYKNLYLPLQAFDRVYNKRIVQEDGSLTSVREILNDKLWKKEKGSLSAGADKYFLKLFNDIQGVKVGGGILDGVIGRFRGATGGAAIGFNLKSYALPMTSYTMSLASFDLDVLIRALTILPKKGMIEELEKLSPLAMSHFEDDGYWRAMTTDAPITNRAIRKISDIATAPIEFMDTQTILRVWFAAQLQAEKDGHGARGTAENQKYAVEMFENAVREGHSTSSMTARSGLQRSNSEFGKAISMFTADSVKLFSRLFGAVDKLLLTWKKAKADPKYRAELEKVGKESAKKIASVAASVTAVAVLSMIVKQLTGTDDEDKNAGEEMLADAVDATVGMFPVVSQVYGILSNGYGVNTYSADTLEMLTDGIGDVMTLAGGIMSGEAQDETKLRGALRRTLINSGKLVGLPVGSAQKYAIGILSKINPSAGYRAKSYFYSKDYVNDMKKAIANGDEDLAANIYSLMEKRSRTGSEATDRTANEVTWLYAAGHKNVLAKQIGTTVKVGGETVTLTKKQKSAITKIYGEAEDVIEEMIGSAQYPELDDDARAAAIKSVYDSYYAYALSEVMGEEYSRDNALKMLWTGKNDYLYHVALAYVKSLKSETDASGKTVSGSRRKAAETYLKKLGLSEEERTIVLWGAGYRSDTDAEKLSEIISAKGLSSEQKEVLKTAL